MAEYSNAALQTVAAGADVIFTDAPIPCTRGYVVHREDSGLFKLRGITDQCRARYRVTFGANIAVPTGGTVGPTSLAIAVDGEALTSTIMTVTPAAVGEFFNVSRTINIDVPRGCCGNVSIRNIGADPVDVANANIIIDRVA